MSSLTLLKAAYGENGHVMFSSINTNKHLHVLLAVAHDPLLPLCGLLQPPRGLSGRR